MENGISDIRELIAASQVEKAMELLQHICKDNRGFLDQVILLSDKFREARKKERLNLISAAEASLIRSQVNNALLEMANEVEGKTSILKPAKTVFISYSSTDVAVAKQLKEMLENKGVQVIIDFETIQAGDDIRLFIEKCIRDSETTISIISRKSLLSTWVAMESINTFYHEKTNLNKKFIACYLDDVFFDRHFTDSALDEIDEQLRQLETLRKARAEKGRNTLDINNEYTRLKNLGNSMDEIVRRLRECLCIDIRGDKLAINFNKILDKVQS